MLSSEATLKILTCICVLLAICVPVVSAAKEPLNAVGQWNDLAVQGVREAKLGAPMAARALAIVHTCMYNAWAAYDRKAVGTQLRGVLRRPASERTEANKERAISYAAYRALLDVLPADTESVYKPLMRQLGYDPDDKSTDIETPTGIGNVACAEVLGYRHRDKSNQIGEMDSAAAESAGRSGIKNLNAIGAYSDWTGYRPLNAAGMVPAQSRRSMPLNPDHWQPLTYTDSTGSLALQMFEAAQWCFITPFAMTKGDDFRSSVEPGPFKYGSPEYQQQAEELIRISANLSDREKAVAEYWSDGVITGATLERWMDFARYVSTRDHHTLDEDVKMYFVLTNALLDASIAAWDAKRTYDSVRPVTAINFLFNGKRIRAWGGPGKGTIEMDGSQWLPFQFRTLPSPPTPECVSEQSTFSAAAARVLELWTGGQDFGYSVTVPAGSSRIEPGLTPVKPLDLKWATFRDAANDAGMAGRYGGIQFARGDMVGRKLGELAADRAWEKAQSYFQPENSAPTTATSTTAGH
jgi:Domain of unknown function (DUF6851)/VCPO second helical-bundle domain